MEFLERKKPTVGKNREILYVRYDSDEAKA